MRLVLGLMFLCLLGAPARCAEWRAMSFPDLGLTAQLPGEPRRQQQQDPDTKTMVTYLAARGPEGIVYVIGAADLSPVLHNAADREGFATGVLRGARGDRAVVEADHAVKTKGANGREALFRDDRFAIRVRAFLSGAWGYTATVMAPAADAARLHDPEVDRFLDSLTPQPR
jgi:hypothetical protein